MAKKHKTLEDWSKRELMDLVCEYQDRQFELHLLIMDLTKRIELLQDIKDNSLSLKMEEALDNFYEEN